MPRWQLDRIYVRGFHIERAAALTGRDWAQRSDHVPLVAELARGGDPGWRTRPDRMRCHALPGVP